MSIACALLTMSLFWNCHR